MAALEEARGERTALEGSSSSVLMLRPSGADDGCCRGADSGEFVPGAAAAATTARTEVRGGREPNVAVHRECFGCDNASMHLGLELAFEWLNTRDI